MRRPHPATALAVLFALSALSDAGNLGAWAAAGAPGPAAPVLVHVPAGLLAAAVAAGAWSPGRRARWAAPLAAAWGLLGATAALVLGPRAPAPPDLPPEAPALLPRVLPFAVGAAAILILALGLGTAAYLRRAAAARPAA
jgi:hypothetical protein